MDAEIDRDEPVPDEKALFRGWRLPRGDEFVPICILCFRVLRNEEDRNHVKATKRYLDVLKERGSIDENFCISALNDISVPLMCEKCAVKFQKDPEKSLVSVLFRSAGRIVDFCTSVTFSCFYSVTIISVIVLTQKTHRRKLI